MLPPNLPRHPIWGLLPTNSKRRFRLRKHRISSQHSSIRPIAGLLRALRRQHPVLPRRVRSHPLRLRQLRTRASHRTNLTIRIGRRRPFPNDHRDDPRIIYHNNLNRPTLLIYSYGCLRYLCSFFGCVGCLACLDCLGCVVCVACDGWGVTELGTSPFSCLRG